MCTVIPKIHASVHIPPAISFSSDDEPIVTLYLLLQFPSGYPTYPVTIYRPISPFRLMQNTLPIHNTRTGRKSFGYMVGYMDICMRRDPGIRLIPTQDGRFITLSPGEPHIRTYGFRPFGHEIYTPERVASVVEEKYGPHNWGMQLLEVGEEYELAVAEGLMAHEWMVGDKEALINERAKDEVKWQKRIPALEVVPGKSIRFRVEK